MKFLILFLAIFLAFPEPTSGDSALIDLMFKAFKSIEITEELKKYEGRVVVETTLCSGRCGPGTQNDKRCLLWQTGKRTDCLEVPVGCFDTSHCGMKVNRLEVGQSITLDCQPQQQVGSNKTIGYSWREANGMITKDDTVYSYYASNSPALTFSNIQEKDAGSYRCGIKEDGQLVKVVYFGVQVIDPTIIDLNVKRIEAKGNIKSLLDTSDPEYRAKLLAHKWALRVVFGVGIPAGVLPAIAALLLYHHLRRKKPQQQEFDV